MGSGSDENAWVLTAAGAWAAEATRGLCDSARERVTREITAHMAAAVDAGLAAGTPVAEARLAAWTSLGDPVAANKVYRRSYLTTYQFHLIRDLVTPSRVMALLWQLGLVYGLMGASLGLYGWSAARQGILATVAVHAIIPYFVAIAVYLFAAGWLVPRLARAGHVRRALVWYLGVHALMTLTFFLGLWNSEIATVGEAPSFMLYPAWAFLGLAAIAIFLGAPLARKTSMDDVTAAKSV